MIDELKALGILKPWKGDYVLTRKGQVIYGGSDPYYWKKKKGESMSKTKIEQEVKKVFPNCKLVWER